MKNTIIKQLIQLIRFKSIISITLFLIFFINIVYFKLYKTPKIAHGVTTNLNVGSSNNIAQALGNLKIIGGLGVGSFEAPQTSGQAVFSGNVGLGTTSPLGKFHISTGLTGNASERVLMRIDDYNVGGGGTELFVIGEAGSNETIINNTWNKLHLGAGGGASHIVKTLTVSSSNIGIGTTNPNTPLHILADSNRNTPLLTIQSTGAFGGGGGYDKGLLLDVSNAAASSSLFNIKYVGNSLLYVQTGGNIGIGTTAPAAKLDVVGAAKISTTINGVDTASGTTIHATYAP